MKNCLLFFNSDFDIKVHNIETKKQKTMLGHQAPILSAQIDPLDSFVVSYLHFKNFLNKEFFID